MKKLLLRRDVAKLGHVGDVVEVSEGYARNYLVPHHLAVEPTPANLKAIEDEKKQAQTARLEQRRALELRVEAMADVEVTISAAANEEGHLYGSVGPREIAAALLDEGHDVKTAQVELHHPIRQLDTVMVPIVFAEDLKTEIKVWVVRERASEAAEEEAASEGQDALEAAPAPAAGEAEEESGHGGSQPADEPESW